MSILTNSVRLTGRLGANPEIHRFASGKQKANFSIATTEFYYNKSEEKQEDTQWHNLIVWGKLVDVVEKYLKKGSKITIEGKLESKSWESEGRKYYRTEVNVRSLNMIDGTKESQQVNNAESAVTPPDSPMEEDITS